MLHKYPTTGNVEYSPTGFMEKNMETLNTDLVGAMLSSNNALLRRMFEPPAEEKRDPAVAAGSAAAGGAVKGKKLSSGAVVNRSISWRFQNQLTSLMTMLKKTTSHFIRCIKSNEKCKPLVFEAPLVNRQLLYSGVFEVVKIQQSGLPFRSTHDAFLERFKCLAPSSARWKLKTAGELISYLKLFFELPHCQMGATLTFYKGSEQRVLEWARDTLLKNAQTLIAR